MNPLMSSKSEEQYKTVFCHLQTTILHRFKNFKTVITDYETAEMNTVQAQLHREPQGCHFHSVKVAETKLKLSNRI